MLDIKDIHDIEMQMIVELTDFFDKNHIDYFLDYGTLIGAVRHKGFIPWDDDVDISMTRDQYNKFLDIVKAKKNFMINDHLLVTSPELKNTNFTFCKVYNLNYKVHEKTIKLDDEYLWIDVFPYDKLSNSLDDNKRNYKKILIINKLIDIKRLKTKQLFNLSRNRLFFVMKIMVKFAMGLISINYLTRKVNKIASNYKNTECDYAQNMTHISDLFSGEKISDLNDLIDIEFEGKKFKTLKNYDNHLKNLYGDYMVLPSINERETHIEDIIYVKNNVNKDIKKF